MFISADEMKSVLYEYQIEEITEENDDIVTEGIEAAISEVKSYFHAANNRREMAGLNSQQYNAWKLYDVDAIFNATGNARNKFVMRIVQRVAAWNICELANPDVIYERVKTHYDNAITTLEKIAGMGEYANSQMVLTDLPSPTPVTPSEGTTEKKPFRMISRPKFQHE